MPILAQEGEGNVDEAQADLILSGYQSSDLSEERPPSPVRAPSPPPPETKSCVINPKRKKELRPISSGSDTEPFPKMRSAVSVAPTSEKPKRMIRCKFCSKEIGSLRNVKRQVREVHSAKLWTFLCPFCPSSFGRKASTRRHIAATHPEMSQPPMIHV